MASLPGPNPNLFSTLPTTPPPSTSKTSKPPKPPIPFPKYPPPQKSRNHPLSSPALKTHHRNTKYYKPIKPGQRIPLPDAQDREIIVSNSGISYHLPGAPFEFMFSYSEMPKAEPVAMREPAFLPFAPPSMPRPWTGKAPMKKSKRRNVRLLEGFGKVEDLGEKRYEMLKGFEVGKMGQVRPRQEVLGAPLLRWEVNELLKRCMSSNRQVNLGEVLSNRLSSPVDKSRDGLTHNMLELIHTHWRREPVCKVRCLGVPTVDMNNICRCLEERTGGKIIRRLGGVVYLFRGRNYDHQKRPKLPVMLWKPATPVYPKLIQDAPEGLTKEAADSLRAKGKSLLPICKLAKNGVYVTLARDVRTAFEGCILVKIDCRGLEPSDYKKIGAKLKELVPCVLLSFDDEQILLWRGREWKSMYNDEIPKLNVSPSASSLAMAQEDDGTSSRKTDAKSVISSPRMMFLWQRAIESGKASILEEMDLSPDDLLWKVEEFDSTCQALEHSYPAMIYSKQEGLRNMEGSDFTDDDDADYNAEVYIKDSSVPLGSLPVDSIVMQLSVGEDDF